MARVKGGTKLPMMGLPPLRLQQKNLFAAAILNRGMISDIDPADIPNEALSVLRNARVRRDRTSRRIGKSVFSGAAPNVSCVRRLITFEPSLGSIFLIRLTGAGGHYTEGTTWTALTGVLSGGSNFLDVAVAEGTLVIANGSDRLQKIDLSAGTISNLSSNAPRCRYVTGFAERVVAASIGNTPSGTSTLYWSGNRNIVEFDAIEDISAGNKPIITSGRDVVDPITGLFGLTNVMIIPREGSIWLCTKQSIASDPLNPYSAISGIGADIPSAIAKTENGIIFVSLNNGGIFEYNPSILISRDSDLALPVYNEILDDIEDAVDIFSTYDKSNSEYHLGIPNSDYTSCKVWVWNTKAKAWSYDEIDGASCLLTHTRLVDYTSFDDLTGTFDALTGTFDELSITPRRESVVLTGFNTGEIFEEDGSVVTDNGTTFTFEARSKEFKFPAEDELVAEINFEYDATITGTLTLQYTKDSGTTWTTLTTHTIVIGKSNYFRYKRPIKTRRIMWRITSTDGLFDLINFEVHNYAAGESTS